MGNVLFLSLISVISIALVVLGIIMNDYAEDDAFQAGVGTLTALAGAAGVVAVVIYSITL